MSRPSIWSWRNAIRKSELPPLAKLCCYVLADYMSDVEKGCFPSVVTLMKDTGLSNTSIAKHIRLAIEVGLLIKHRFRDRAGHCAGTNYYPRFPDGVPDQDEEATEPASLGARSVFDLPEENASSQPRPACSRRSPWADYPVEKSLNETSNPHEFQSAPALTSLTHNLPVEPSNRKLLQQRQDEVQLIESEAASRSDVGEARARQDETEIAFLAWTQVAQRLAVPAYASQLTVARRSLLRQALSRAGGLQGWLAILERLPKAKFLLGQGKREFWISFEALCSENIRVKLLEGAYDRVPSAPTVAKPVKAVQQVPIERWRERLKSWLSNAKAAADAWPASWGPAPGTEGCLVPPECLVDLSPSFG